MICRLFSASFYHEIASTSDFWSRRVLYTLSATHTKNLIGIIQGYLSVFAALSCMLLHIGEEPRAYIWVGMCELKKYIS